MYVNSLAQGYKMEDKTMVVIVTITEKLRLRKVKVLGQVHELAREQGLAVRPCRPWLCIGEPMGRRFLTVVKSLLVQALTLAGFQTCRRDSAG